MTSPRHKRLLFFNDSLALGGTEQLLVNLLNHLAQKRCTVTLLLPEKSETNILLPKISEEVEIKYLFEDGISSFKRWKEENKMIFKTASFLKQKSLSEDDYDEVICFKEGFYAKMFADWMIPKTLWLHNILYVREYNINSLKERLAVWLNKKKIAKVQESYAHYDRVISVSEACKQSYLNVVFDGHLPIQDIRIIPNAIDQERIIELAQESIAEEWDEKHPSFILLTRTSPDKRIDRMLTSASKLVQENYQFQVHILGKDTDNTSIKDQIQELGLTDTIYLHGEKSNPYPYIKKSDWLICVSERESFSLAILEAMILGVPVVTTDCGGPTNITEKGKYGLLVENSSEGVYQGMKAILEDKNLATKYTADLSKCTAKYQYADWLKTIDKLLSV